MVKKSSIKDPDSPYCMKNSRGTRGCPTLPAYFSTRIARPLWLYQGGLMFLQHGGNLCWGKIVSAVREVPLSISKRAVSVGLEKAFTFHIETSDYPVTSHIAGRAGQMHLPHPKAWCTKHRG